MTVPLPAGVSLEDMTAALEKFRRIAGDEWVLTGPDAGPYDDPYPITDPETDHRPYAAVAPATTAQVQEIVKVANEHGIPLWPVSRGKNFAYGGAAPVLTGTVVLDLKRLNRILEVNEEFGYALVEPGVSYFDLYDYIQEKGLKLWLDVPDPGWGSVVGNALDHGIGYTPYGDHFAMQCGMEVVLPTGDIVRTGMGAMPGNNSWQLFKYGFGPYVDGMFSQSNFGIVTKMGIWLMPEPPYYEPYMISFEREEDIEQVIEILRPLKVGSIIQNAATVRSLILDASITSTKAQYYDGAGPLPPSAARKIMDDQKLGMWNFCGALYGPPPVAETLWTVIRDSFAAVPGVKFYKVDDRPQGFDLLRHRADTMRGIPKMTEFNLCNWTGGGGHTGFSPVSPITGRDAVKQYEMVKKRMHEYGYDYMGLLAIGWREMHHVSLIVYDQNDADERKKVDELFNILIDEAAAEGYGEYRTHINFMDRIAGTYSWNNNALWRMHETIKDALDPNGILAPGKSGIWPQNRRG
ncbi:FAD-binding oxidoreductase [Emcibacter nanhaiensis]|uniref:FAD-binding oxidoreductase n=1 Tax=Emcibacter nanhaiensis TaxID=1505037 RepID=A0A501PBY7_9PROT|nr:FAD-binding oxidoreductase [Emcibacter nanhaiensis]TPD57919.1 FAD-binding oxidoreductase [Emcibacter nanhaiensis]